MSEEAGVTGLPPRTKMSASPPLLSVELSALCPAAPPGGHGAGGRRGAAWRRRAVAAWPCPSSSAGCGRCWGIPKPAGSAPGPQRAARRAAVVPPSLPAPVRVSKNQSDGTGSRNKVEAGDGGLNQ
ncbi:uncharacterized protein ACIBXB_015273 isoform 2-T12 [Morphnus guianensis]